jgi:predicted HTH transcriptional regulator
MNTDRYDPTSHRLPVLLVEQPAISTSYMAQRLGISDRAARSAISQACERGILTKVGNAQRGAFYQATDLITIPEEASSVPNIRRMVAS